MPFGFQPSRNSRARLPGPLHLPTPSPSSQNLLASPPWSPTLRLGSPCAVPRHGPWPTAHGPWPRGQYPLGRLRRHVRRPSPAFLFAHPRSRPPSFSCGLPFAPAQPRPWIGHSPSSLATFPGRLLTRAALVPPAHTRTLPPSRVCLGTPPVLSRRSVSAAFGHLHPTRAEDNPSSSIQAGRSASDRPDFLTCSRSPHIGDWGINEGLSISSLSAAN